MTTLTGASLEQLISWVTQAGILALDHQQGDLRAGVSIKADDTIVTIADHKVESFLATQLRTTFPDDSLVAEEGSRYNVRPDGRIWTFDPIDGTKLFYLQLPGWGISLGYLEQGQPAAGFFYMPTIEDLTWGFGSQVYHYHHKNNLDSLPDLKYDSNAQSLIGAVQTRWDEQYGTLATLANFPRRFRTDLSSVRTLGGVTASVVYVAQGKATAALFTHPWPFMGHSPGRGHSETSRR